MNNLQIYLPLTSPVFPGIVPYHYSVVSNVYVIMTYPDLLSDRIHKKVSTLNLYPIQVRGGANGP